MGSQLSVGVAFTTLATLGVMAILKSLTTLVTLGVVALLKLLELLLRTEFDNSDRLSVLRRHPRR